MGESCGEGLASSFMYTLVRDCTSGFVLIIDADDDDDKLGAEEGVGCCTRTVCRDEACCVDVVVVVVVAVVCVDAPDADRGDGEEDEKAGVLIENPVPVGRNEKLRPPEDGDEDWPGALNEKAVDAAVWIVDCV